MDFAIGQKGEMMNDTIYKTKRGLYNLVIGYYMASHGWVCGMNNNVTAWAPLPEPYNEENRT